MRRVTTSIGVLSIVGLLAAPAGPAAASKYKPSAPFVAHMRATLVSGRPAAGASVWVFPDVTPKHKKAVLHVAWETSTNANGAFTVRAMYRSHVRRAAVQNGGWVNFMVIVSTARRFGVWEFPARWSQRAWHPEPGSLPSSIVLSGHTTKRGHGHH
jgi:hypothetical protein